MTGPPRAEILDRIPRGPLVDGRWQEGVADLSVVDPATAEPFATVRTADEALSRKGVDRAALVWQTWRRTPGKARGEALRRLARTIESQAEDFAYVIMRENGKPLAQARGEVAMTVDHLEWFADEARRVYGRIVPPHMPGKRHWVMRQSVGVVGAIAPWNFPLVLAVRKLAPAVAAGCPVVLKPASATPLSSQLLGQATLDAEWPEGLLQIVPGPAEEVTKPFFEHRACRKITFTGSTAVGKRLIVQAADQVKKLSLELGGHAPVVVFGDADLEQAVQGAIIAKFRNTGQSCIAANRVYVEASIYDAFIERFVAATCALPVGPGWEPGVEIGPLIDAASVESAGRQVEQALDAGANLACGGKPIDRPGFFFAPTVLTDVPDDAVCLREESFAPLIPVAKFDSEEEVIRRANDTDYGLAAYLFTRDLSRAIRVAEALEAGTIGLNDPVPATSQSPFGGMKQSGWGRELGSEGIDAYLETKHVSIGGVDA